MRSSDSPVNTATGGRDRVGLLSSGALNRRSITRREAITYLGRGVVVAGAVASGVGLAPSAMAEGTTTDGNLTERRLRSVCWSAGELYGLVDSGPDIANIQRLALDGSTLRVGGDVIADVGVAAGPVAMAADAGLDRFVLARSTLHVLREETYSFDLEDDLAKWFEEEGVPAPAAPTSGTGTYRVTVVRPSFSVVSAKRPQAALPLIGSLPDVSLEPIALTTRSGGYELLATSSGRYGVETNLADEVVVVSLSGDGSIVGLYPVVTGLGHDVNEVRAVETSAGGFTVSVRTSKETRFFADRVGEYAEISPSSSWRSFALHDRIPVSGMADSWLAEVSPGVFVIESGRN